MELRTWKRGALALKKSALDEPLLQSSDSSAGLISSRAIVVTKCTQVQKEIVRSEESYIKGLRTLVRVFLRPMEKWVAQDVDDATITSDDIGEIFANAEAVLAFNEHLLRKLVDDVNDHRCIGLTFQGATDMLETYSVYVRNYQKAMKRLALCESHPSFKVFYRACEYQDACNGLDLRAYLIQPVQRVPRYRLLLMELLKRTRKSHPHWAHLKKALEYVSRIATKLDEEAHDTLQLMRALDLQAEFGQNFLTPSSRLLKEGLLHKVCNGGPRPYKFVLLNDTLIYGTETMMTKLSRTIDSSGSESRKYKAHRRIPCNEFLILDDVDSSDSFLVICRRGKSFMVVAASAEDKQEWMRAFGECFDGIPEFTRADEGAPSLNSTVSSRQVSDSTLDDSSKRNRHETRDIFVENSDDGTTVTDNAILATGYISGACTAQQPKPRSSSAQSSMAALAESVSTTMSAGLQSLGYGKKVDDSSQMRASTAITTALNDGFTSSEGITSLGAMSASYVQVWMVVDGRTEKVHVSLRRLPPGSHHGVFKIRQTVIGAGENNETSPPTAYTTDAQSDDGISNNSLSSGFGNTTQETGKERNSRRLVGDRVSVGKILAIARQESPGVTLGSRPPGEEDYCEAEGCEVDPERSKTPFPLGKTSWSGPEDEDLASYQGRGTDGTEEDTPGAHHLTRCSHVHVECVNEMNGSNNSPPERAEPDHEATFISGTSDITPVSTADITIAHEPGVVGYTGYDSEGGSASTDDEEAAQRPNRSRRPRFLRGPRLRGTHHQPKTIPTVTRSRSLVKQVRRSSSAANLMSSLYMGRYRLRRERSTSAGSRRVWATETGDAPPESSAGEEEQPPAGGEH